MTKLKEEILKEKLIEMQEKNKKRREEEEDDEDDKRKKEEGKKKEKENGVKVTSVFLFKKIYNEACPEEKQKDNEKKDQ